MIDCPKPCYDQLLPPASCLLPPAMSLGKTRFAAGMQVLLAGGAGELGLGVTRSVLAEDSDGLTIPDDRLESDQ